MKRRRIRKKRYEEKIRPYTRLKISHLIKYFVLTVLIISTIIIIPLTLVWKQVYINNASVHFDSLKDSLDVLHKEVAALNIVAEQLSSTERIERIANKSLGLDYPLFKEIVIIRPMPKKEKIFVFDSPFWAVIKKSISSEKG